MKQKVLTKNRRATYDYTLHDQFTAGLVLKGFEVKGIREGNADLKGAFVTIKNGEAWLTNAHIKQYSKASNIDSYNPTQPRKLLLSSKELAKLLAAKQNKLTIIPLSIIAHGPYIKLNIATAQGKKKHDKRHKINRKDTQKDLKNTL